jgi:selenocysteine lyase/cysteine desulfurase
MLADLVPGDEGALSRRDRLVRSMDALEEYEDRLHRRLEGGLDAIEGVHRFGGAPRRTPTELFAIDGVASPEVYRALAQRGINAPAGSFYALEASERLGLGAGGAVRAGLAPYTSVEDVDRLLAAVAELATG